MNLTWHIVKKDLRALKWPLLLWTLIIVGKLGIGVALLTATSTVNADWLANWFVRMDLLAKVLTALEYVSFVLVAAVIHEDLLVGTTAFWMTRPISGGRLLRAKLLGIGLIFGVLPVLVTLPWWLGCGYGLREIAWAALETVAVQAICVLLGLLWGVVTDGFARFLMWTLVLLFAVPTVSGIIGLQLSGLKVQPSQDLMLTRVWVIIAIGVLATLVVTVHQFLTRRTWRSVGIIVATVGLIVAAGLWWPWNFKVNTKWKAYLEERAEKEAPVSMEPAGLQFAVDPPRLVSPPGAPADRVNQIHLNFSVAGVPEGRELQAYGGRYSLHWPDGSVESGASWFRRTDNIFRRASLKALGVSPKPGEETDRQNFYVPVYLPLATASRVQTEAPGYSVKALFRMLQFGSTEKFPVQPGARIWTGSISERVAHVETMDQQILLTYIRSWPDLTVDQTARRFEMAVPGYSLYALFNEAAGKVDLGKGMRGSRSRIASVVIYLQVVAYGDPRKVSKKAALPESWLRNADLVRQTFTEESRFFHEIKIDRFPTETTNP